MRSGLTARGGIPNLLGLLTIGIPAALTSTMVAIGAGERPPTRGPDQGSARLSDGGAEGLGPEVVGKFRRDFSGSVLGRGAVGQVVCGGQETGRFGLRLHRRA